MMTALHSAISFPARNSRELPMRPRFLLFPMAVRFGTTASGAITKESTRAKVLAGCGQTSQAESLAREAVALAAESDFLVLRGDTLMDLAEVLRLVGRPSEAVPAVEEALRLYEQKGNTVSAARARALLSEGV